MQYHLIHATNSIQVHEFEISRGQAEKALVENGGDISKTLQALVNP
jgi:hypothetical protein